MMIYLIATGEYEDYQIQGAFATIEDAERAKFLWGFDQDQSTEIEELEVLTIPELPKHNKTPFKVKIHAKDADAPVYVSKGWVGISSIEEGYSFLGDVIRFYVYAKDETEAMNTAINYFRTTLSKPGREKQQEEQWYPLQGD